MWAQSIEVECSTTCQEPSSKITVRLLPDAFVDWELIIERSQALRLPRMRENLERPRGPL